MALFRCGGGSNPQAVTWTATGKDGGTNTVCNNAVVGDYYAFWTSGNNDATLTITGAEEVGTKLEWTAGTLRYKMVMLKATSSTITCAQTPGMTDFMITGALHV